MHVLVLGGTGEGRALAAALHARGTRVTSSLAGRVPAPRRPPGEVRTGGFGGVDGLAAWLLEHAVDRLVDATHPFAAAMSANASVAAAATGVPLLRLQRPGWTAGPGDDWHWADDLVQVAERVDGLGTRVLLTTGRLEVAAFAGVRAACVIRTVTPPDGPLPEARTLLQDRGPYTLAGERALLREHAIDLVVTKDSGGDATAPKLLAARERGIPVLLVRRPSLPPAATATSVAAVLAWVAAPVGLRAGIEARPGGPPT